MDSYGFILPLKLYTRVGTAFLSEGGSIDLDLGCDNSMVGKIVYPHPFADADALPPHLAALPSATPRLSGAIPQSCY
jgi:hypothetical protein